MKMLIKYDVIKDWELMEAKLRFMASTGIKPINPN
jgi:hypothetical protein